MKRFSFTRGPSLRRTIPVIGTLGPERTSSDCVAHRFCRWTAESERIEMRVALFESFEVVRQALLDGDVDLALVPHAWKEINDFYFTPTFRHLLIFKSPTPSYGLVDNPVALRANCPVRLATHPAPRLLIDDLIDQNVRAGLNVEFVLSTSVVARMVAEGTVGFGITNEDAARAFGLEFVREYGPIDMSWSIFSRKNDPVTDRLENVMMPVELPASGSTFCFSS